MSGLFSMIPYILLAILVPISGLLADILRATLLSTTLVRKVFTSVGGSLHAHSRVILLV